MDLHGINKIVTNNLKKWRAKGERVTQQEPKWLFYKPRSGRAQGRPGGARASWGRKGILGAPLHPDRFQKMWIFHISLDRPGPVPAGPAGARTGRKGVETQDGHVETRAKDSHPII